MPVLNERKEPQNKKKKAQDSKKKVFLLVNVKKMITFVH